MADEPRHVLAIKPSRTLCGAPLSDVGPGRGLVPVSALHRKGRDVCRGCWAFLKDLDVGDVLLSG